MVSDRLGVPDRLGWACAVGELCGSAADPAREDLDVPGLVGIPGHADVQRAVVAEDARGDAGVPRHRDERVHRQHVPSAEVHRELRTGHVGRQGVHEPRRRAAADCADGQILDSRGHGPVHEPQQCRCHGRGARPTTVGHGRPDGREPVHRVGDPDRQVAQHPADPVLRTAVARRTQGHRDEVAHHATLQRLPPMGEQIPEPSRDAGQQDVVDSRAQHASGGPDLHQGDVDRGPDAAGAHGSGQGAGRVREQGAHGGDEVRECPADGEQGILETVPCPAESLGCGGLRRVNLRFGGTGALPRRRGGPGKDRIGQGPTPVGCTVEPVAEEDQGAHPIGDRVVHPPDQRPTVLESVDDPHVPQGLVRRQWLLHDVPDGAVETGMRAGRRRIDVVQVRREVRVPRLDPHRAAHAQTAIIEILVQPRHLIQSVSDQCEQLVVRGCGNLRHSDRADGDRRPLALHLQPDEVEGVESLATIGHAPHAPARGGSPPDPADPTRRTRADGHDPADTTRRPGPAPPVPCPPALGCARRCGRVPACGNGTGSPSLC